MTPSATPSGVADGLPAAMQASFLDGIQAIALRTIPLPQIAPSQVLVKIAAVGVCGSDVHYFDHGYIGDYVPEGPMILGHEAAGTIVRTGSTVSPERLGARVSVEPQRPCRHCGQCKAGRYNLCPDIEFLATPPFDGAFTQFLAVEDDFAHAIPDEMSFEAAALCEPLSVGIWAVQKAGVTLGSRLLVTGAGPIGIIILQAALAAGASEVFVSDPQAERRATALRFGATRTIDPILQDVADIACDVDAFIDASGSARALNAGIHAVKPAGRVVLVGSGTISAELPISRIQIRELTITGVFRYANTWPTAIALVASHKIDLDSLVTGKYPLSAAETALRAGKDPSAIKAVVYPNS